MLYGGKMPLKRLVAYSIDYLIHSILFMIVTMVIVVSLFDDLHPDAPFLIILLVYNPITVFINYQFYRDVSWIPTAVFTIFLLQILIYSFEEYLNNGQTLGKKIVKIKVDFNNHKNLGKFILRNIFKVSSIFLLGIPFISMIFTRVTLYDILLKAYVKDV